MLAPIPQQHFAPLGAHRLREGDLVRLRPCVGTFRIRALNYSVGKAVLAHMSGKPAGEWALGLVVPLAGGQP